MIIETKFNIGDEVYFLDMKEKVYDRNVNGQLFNIISNGFIMKITIEVKSNKYISEKYFLLPTNDNDIKKYSSQMNYKLIEREAWHVYNTKEEIEQLLEIRKSLNHNF